MFRPRGQRTGAERRRDADSRRGSARERGYDGAWDKAAKSHLRRSPLCIYCAMGAWGDPPRDQAAELVDHLIPHRGERAVFWRKTDWVSSCAACHDGPKQSVERVPIRLADLAARVRAFIAGRGG